MFFGKTARSADFFWIFFGKKQPRSGWKKKLIFFWVKNSREAAGVFFCIFFVRVFFGKTRKTFKKTLVQTTSGVKNKWFFIRVPRGLFGFDISLPYVGTSSEWRWGSFGSRMVLRRCGVANDLTWFEISRKWAAPERCMYIGKSIGSIKKCMCTNDLWFLWKTRNVCIIMFQSFLKNIRKFQEHFSHDNSYHRNRCVLNYSHKSRHSVRSIVISVQFQSISNFNLQSVTCQFWIYVALVALYAIEPAFFFLFVKKHVLLGSANRNYDPRKSRDRFEQILR